jgi:hypothetical protein
MFTTADTESTEGARRKARGNFQEAISNSRFDISPVFLLSFLRVLRVLRVCGGENREGSDEN